MSILAPMLYYGVNWSETMRVAPAISLTHEQERELSRLARSKRTSVRLAQRAQIVLLAAQGRQNKDIAEQLGIGRVQAARWRQRHLESGLPGIERDLPRGAPSVKVDVAKLVDLTTQTTPEAATHWSTRKMGEVLGVSASTVMRHWHAHGLKPHLVRGFKVSRDPKFAEKLEDIVGLYISPPERALVLCCDEKSQVQALDRTQPGLPLKKGCAQTMTHDYKRNGTTTLFAALNVLDGQVIGQCQKRHTHVQWLKFLRQIDRDTPKDKTLHLIADNYATHKHPKVQAWLAKHSRFHMHFTPTSASWLNMVERFFRDITTDRLRRGVFTSVPQLVAAIGEYITHHNSNPKPFIWTKSARDILQKVIRANSRLSSKQNGTLHYLFDADFCNVASGWEKGVVEKNVQDSRRRVWLEARERKFTSFAELNAWLAERCKAVWADTPHPQHRELSIAEVLQVEREHLMGMPAPFDGYVERPARVSSTCLVTVARNRYSVPCEWAGHMVSTRLYPGRVDVVAGDALVASHERVLNRGQTVFDWQHYIVLVQRKPGALRNGAPFADMPRPLAQLRLALMRHAGGDRVLSEVLALVPTAGLDTLLVAVELVLEHVTPSGHISVEHVRNVLARLSDPQRPPPADTALALREAPRADTHRYDRLRAADTQEAGHAN